ncbi:MAG: 23S rRNA (uracil(1939)-C(5))-methyltransferase RlmD [Oscillospiraceae bacterium]|nr:23S rRNA (uracil(1939)-C(5))-methyltransferase RlmD [Oscillospiraceae bacterium]
MSLAKNQLHTVTIDGYASDGAGVARIDGQVVFVREAIDGETCLIRILRATKSVAWGKLEDILEPSPHRIAPTCPVYGKCGGCDLMHMDYTEELRFKRQRVIDALARLGDTDAPVAPIIAADTQVHYRNKAIFAVGTGPVTGFYRRRSHQIIPVTACEIQREVSNRAATALRTWMAAFDMPAYDETTHRGLIRHLFVRQAASSGQTAVCLVATSGKLPHRDALIETIREHCPETVGIVLCVNREVGNTVLRGEFLTLWGEDSLRDTLSGLTFRLSPQSFFQINPTQAERLYNKALSYAELTDRETVLDLYCGTGTITLCMAQKARLAIGAEIVEQAVLDARENAQTNGITNAQFLLADAQDAARQLADSGISPDVVVVDPPRKGLTPHVINLVAEMEPARVVYVSCDPATLARDLKSFSAHGYAVTEITPVDMFPRCAHVECVVLLQR